jgi:hypothetical protein
LFYWKKKYLCGELYNHKKQPIMATIQEKYTSWETIQKEHPDKFVLLENPVYNPRPHLKEAILLYKHKSRKRVYAKANELKPHYSTIVYTGGMRGDRINELYTFVL